MNTPVTVIEGPVSRAMADVVAERRAHASREGWTAAHDDAHTDGSMAMAAAAYAVHAANPNAQIDLRVGRGNKFWNGGWMGLPRLVWPPSWDWDRWWKPKSKREDLVRAGALIVAEIERLDRAEAARAARAADVRGAE